MLAMKRAGAFLRIRLAVIVALLHCSRLLLTFLWLIELFFLKLHIVFSWPILASARAMDALSRKTVGVTWRLLPIGRAISLRLHSRRKAATTSGT